MDHYARLGVDKTADADAIKKAYKKLAMKHHPDRGGDTSVFQEISQAYDVLSDPQKKAQYDAEQNGYNPFTQHAGPGWHDVSSMFGGSPFEQFFRHATRNPGRNRNRDLNIRCRINLRQSYTGTELEASYSLPSGKTETVIISVPPGIEDGQVIRYNGMGDDTVPNLPRGNLNATIVVEPDPRFERRGLDLVTFVDVNAIEAMIGCVKVVDTLEDSKLRINLRPGLYHGIEFMHSGLGFKNIHSSTRGNLIVHVKLVVPAVTDDNIKKKLEEIYAEINNTPRSNT